MAIAAGLIVAGCSGSDDSADSTTSTSQERSTNPTAESPTEDATTISLPETQEEKDEIAATTEPAPSTTIPEPTAEVQQEDVEISGFIPQDGSESIDVTVESGTTSTLTITPDSGFDIVIAVTGPGQTGEEIDDGLAGDPETVRLSEGQYVLVVSGWLGASGGYTARLSSAG